MEDIGADPALAKAEPVARLGPSGFDPGELLALAERCERAAEPDRVLDGAMAAALGLPHGPDSGWCNRDNGDYWTVDECAKPYTTSLDAAMTLVPEGQHWTASSYGLSEDRPYAYIGWGAPFRAVASTTALALCAAALKARALAPTDTRSAKT